MGVVQTPTVFALAKEGGFSTAMFVGKEKFRHLLQAGTVDEFDFDQSNSREITTSYIGEPKPVTSDTVAARIVAKRAAAYIQRQKPNLCFIHFTDPDDVGHLFGWGSRQQMSALADVDVGLAEVLAAIQAAGIGPESLVIVTADHGGHARTHGSKREEDVDIPWIAWGKNVKPGYVITEPVRTVDTAATVLWALGLPLPANFDGKPVDSAFTSQTPGLASGPRSTAASDERVVAAPAPSQAGAKPPVEPTTSNLLRP
jgi:hypothetical protein